MNVEKIKAIIDAKPNLSTALGMEFISTPEDDTCMAKMKVDERNRQLEQQKFALEKQQYEQTVKDNAYTKAFERANANASQYGSVKDVNKALKSLEKKPAKKRSQYEKLMISALRARRSAVRALEKENTAKTVSKTKKSGDSTTTTTKKVYAKGKAKAKKSKAKAKKGKKK